MTDPRVWQNKRSDYFLTVSRIGAFEHRQQTIKLCDKFFSSLFSLTLSLIITSVLLIHQSRELNDRRKTQSACNPSFLKNAHFLLSTLSFRIYPSSHKGHLLITCILTYTRNGRKTFAEKEVWRDREGLLERVIIVVWKGSRYVIAADRPGTPCWVGTLGTFNHGPGSAHYLLAI